MINKSVMIFGTGHYQDSAIATGVSNIVGNIILSKGSSGGILTGFDIDGDVKVDTAGMDSVSNFTISRCIFRNLFLSSNGFSPTNARNFSIYENVVRGNLYGANAFGINCSKNIVEGSINNFESAVFDNNDFIGLGNCPNLVNMMVGVNTCNFDNNIFLYTTPGCSGAYFFDTASGNNVFWNNIFTVFFNFPVGTNSGFNNYVSQPLNTIFINASGNTFQYTDDYRLKSGSPGVYGGNDGFDVGVYGTIDPFKTASIPHNPHIQHKSIGQMTDQQGKVNIQIRVAAQDH